MRLLGIDYGQKHIGLAVADTDSGLVAPLRYVSYQSQEELIHAIKEAIKETDSKKIVIGYPLSFGFRKTKASEKVKEFANILKTELSVKVELENEILTSALAARYLGYDAGRRKNLHHPFAAALIL
ncbi:MAG: Holliday junction resolvase RuvX, partial [Candidatus Paceibacteria bacterium]